MAKDTKLARVLKATLPPTKARKLVILTPLRSVPHENEVIDDIKQHEDFTLTFRVLDLTSRGLNGVSGKSLGGVDQFRPE